jgi:uncharacterized protein (TIGR04222 family)
MNKLTQQELWGKIQKFAIDEPSSNFPFSKKLAKENNWSASFTEKAIEEYKKFIYLCCISPAGASPSETVDKVWHLHLTYTQNYWIDFCKITLQKDIHHHPSKGGNDEHEKHQNWYRDTLNFYEQTFATFAPADIWPPAPSVVQPIETNIYEPNFFKRILVLFTIIVVLVAVSTNLFSTTGEEFLTYYAFICIGSLVVLYITQVHKNDLLQTLVYNNLPSDYTTFQMARFLYGSHRCYQTALIDLLKRGIIEAGDSNYTIIENVDVVANDEQNPLLICLSQYYKQGDTFTYNQGLSCIDTAIVLHSSLERLHVLSRKVDYYKFIIPGITLLIGFIRCCKGLIHQKPIGFLLAEIGIYCLLALMILATFSYTKSVKNHVSDYWEKMNLNGYGQDVVNNFTILGTPAIAGFAEFFMLSSVFEMVTLEQRKVANTGSAGCGGSSGGCSGGDGGGGGCGGGCGGCGG